MINGWPLRMALWTGGWILIIMSYYIIGILMLGMYAFLMYELWKDIHGDK